MRMAINHPWHDKGAGEIDHLDARGRCTGDALDAMVLDKDEDIVRNLPGLNVEQSSGLDRDRRLSR